MSVIQRLYNTSKPFRGTLTGGLVMMLFTTIIDTAIVPVFFTSLLFLVVGKETMMRKGFSLEFGNFDLGQYFEHLVQSMDPVRLLATLSGFTALTILLKCATESRQGVLMNKFAILMSRDLRQRLFDKFVTLSPVHFEKETTGAHVSRITGDVTALQNCMGVQLAEAVQAPVTILIALIIMFSLDWGLTLAALCLAPVIGILIGAAGRRIRKLTIIIQERLGALNAILVERLGNVRVIQSFVREPYETDRVARLNKEYYEQTMRSVRLAETMAPGIEFIANTGFMLGIIVGGIAVFRGHMPPENFMLFLFLAQRTGVQFKRLSRINQVRQQANGAGARIFEVLDIVPEIRDAEAAIDLPPVQGHVVCENVSFRYHTGEEVLSGVEFTAAPGEVIAIVGPSGSGKTTLVNLLPRFYDPSDGRILVDGHDLRTVRLESLRMQVGSVPQETSLFSGSIIDNIRYGKLDATDEEIIAAARAANALEFIERLPEGFETLVGERGTRLSGGQRQRVAIARAVLKNPRILILDEATSALDTESEMLVQQALDRLMEGRTTFVIAHRLSTVQHATRILVLDKGRIVEQGTHTELLTIDGVYRRLYEIQFRTNREMVIEE